MDKLLELLGAHKLNEADEAQVKERLETLIEVKANELSESKLQEAKEQLVESYENKFEEYKEDITSKFSNFVDSVLEEEMVIPDKILEYAKKGELYNDLIEQFKIRLSVDEGLLDEEVKSILKEAKEEILSLRSDMDKIISENLEVKQDATELAAELYLRRKCDGLTESQKTKILEMLSGITDREEIDRKFKFVLEMDDMKDKDKDKDEEDEEEDDDDYEDKEKKKDMKEAEKGKGKVDMEDDEEDEEEDEDDMNEATSPFKQHLNMYKQILREGKF